MRKVITYGTYDLLHYGHIRLLERAKALGDYLIVGVTADDFDKTRGKINVQQPLMERILAVKETGIADEIIVEEYEGQKIDDILRYDVDIFAIGSDWKGKFDYLNEYCNVVYLERTQGVSSTELRAKNRLVRVVLVGDTRVFEKYQKEAKYVNGVEIVAAYTKDHSLVENNESIEFTNDYNVLLDQVDAVFIVSHPEEHYDQIKQALLREKHVLCESPVTLSTSECRELFGLAKEKNVVLMDGIKTAYSTAYHRLLLLAKSGRIGHVISVEATCTSTKELIFNVVSYKKRNSMCAWGPTAMLPVFQLLGTDYQKKTISSYFKEEDDNFDLFSKIDFNYENAVASVKVGKGVKAEGELIIAGTKGYIYVPAPWWKTDYFEIRYENPTDNKRYFYQLDGEGIRYQIVAFIKSIESGKSNSYIQQKISEQICTVIEEWYEKKQLNRIVVVDD